MKISYSQAINKALTEEMKKNKNLICFGLGVNDSLKFFGTTTGLKEKFGKERVFETPTSENAMTGIGVGMSLYKNPCVMMHQRLDFFLLAMDQLVNGAAKWRFMFGGKNNLRMFEEWERFFSNLTLVKQKRSLSVFLKIIKYPNNLNKIKLLIIFFIPEFISKKIISET